MFYKIAKTLSVTASIIGILMMAGACSVKSQELFYLYAALGITTLTTGAFALEYFRILQGYCYTRGTGICRNGIQQYWSLL